MITLGAKINVLPIGNGEITGLGGTLYNPQQNLLSVMGQNAFYGTSRFEDSELSDRWEEFSETKVLEIFTNGEAKNVFVGFDIINGRHPKSARLSFVKREVIQERVDLSSSSYGYDGGIMVSIPAVDFIEPPTAKILTTGTAQGAYIVSATYIPQLNSYQVAVRASSAGYAMVEISYAAIVEKEYTLSAPYLFIEMGTKEIPLLEDFEIKFNTWNAVDSPVVISGVWTGFEIEVSVRNMLSCDGAITERGDFKLPSFGIISNSGNIEFVDSFGYVADFAKNDLLIEGLKCELILKNTLVDGKAETVGVFETDEWNYAAESKNVSVSITDGLVEWQSINVDGLNYDPRVKEAKPFKWLYEYLWGITSANYDMLSFDELNDETKTVLGRTYVAYPLLETDDLWAEWTKLCEACQAHIYKGKNGRIVFRYNGGN